MIATETIDKNNQYQGHYLYDNDPADFFTRQQTPNPVSSVNDKLLNNLSFPDTLTENRLKTLLHALPAGVVVVDGQGMVNECNPAAISLLGEPLLGEVWRDVINRSFRATPSGQDVVTNNNRIVNISTCPLGGNFPGQIILLQDVTSNRQLQSQLEQQKRLATMGQMAAQLAHQIRTPIASALLYASHLKKSDLSKTHRLRFANKVLDRIQKLEKLIKDMLLFSNNGMDKGDVFNLNTLLNEIQQEVSVDANIQMQFSNAVVETKNIFGNRHLLVSALSNLLENAQQAMNSEITENDTTQAKKVKNISLLMKQSCSDMIDIVITDNGPGIDETIKERIFEPFFTTKSSGTGLGLAVVKAICQGHHGDIWVENTSVKGTSFVVRLPLYQQ